MQVVKASHSLKQTTLARNQHIIDIVEGVEVGTQRVTNVQVPVGARITSIVCNLSWIMPTGSGTGNIDFYVMQRRSGQNIGDIPTADWSDIGNSNVRNQIFHSDMGLIGTEDAGAFRRAFRLKIPKKFQRVREGDKWTLVYDITDNMETAHGFRFKWRL